MPERGRPFAVKHGCSQMRAYNSWKKMMQRCYSPSNKDYPRYGGRGIEVAERWHNPRFFVDDMGEREAGWSLERKDVDGNYCPENCCWILMSDQPKNRGKWKHSGAGLRKISKTAANSNRNRPPESFLRKTAQQD